MGVGLCRGVRVGAGKGDGTLIVDLGYGDFGEEIVVVSEAGGSDVGKPSGYALCESVRGGVSSDSEETSRSQGEGGRGPYTRVPMLATCVAAVLFVLFFLFPGAEPAACAKVEGGLLSIVGVEDGRGKGGQVIFAGTKLLASQKCGKALV